MPTRDDTHQRALAINLDNTIYGSFAEIGAGQEIARWFFHVGGAAGTVARTISAYDMAMSDALYGKADRYVSRARLEAMLAKEHALLVEQLGPTRGGDARFFAIADTIAARNYAGTNECHGWIGLRFLHEAGAAPSDVTLHVNLMDGSNLQQQQAVGVLGVNLIHAAYHARGSAETFLKAIFHELQLSRLEVDVADVRGPAFATFDAAGMALRLVGQGLARAVVFGKDGALTTASELLRKRPLVVDRGAVGKDLARHAAQLAAASRQLAAELGADAREPVAFFEVPVGAGASDDAALRARIAQLSSLGFPVAVTAFGRAFELAAYVRRWSTEPLRFALDSAGVAELLLAHARPSDVGDGLQALGRVLSEGVKLYAFPLPAAEFRDRLERAGADPASIGHDPEGLVRPDRLQLPSPMRHVYDYLVAAGWLVSLEAPTK